MILKKTFIGISLGAGIVLLSIPFFVFANGEDAEIVPHENDVVLEQELIEEEEHFIGDEHIDHTHASVSTVQWWKSPVWWGLFLTSLVLILLLSYGVYKFLQDKPIKNKSSLE